jgi:sporulation protein YunB
MKWEDTTMKKMTFALCFCNRGFMPGELIYGAREDMVKAVTAAGYDYIMMDAELTRYGGVETRDEGRLYAKWLKEHEGQYDGVIFSMPIFADENGAITAVSANALKINKIARDTASISQSNLKNLSLNGIPVPLGALTGIEAFAGLGPSIHFRIIPVSSVSCGFSSSFESVGINQTKHSIYLNVIADISIVMPSRTQNFDVVTDMLVGEFIIGGSIPDTYLQTDIFQKPIEIE